MLKDTILFSPSSYLEVGVSPHGLIRIFVFPVGIDIWIISGLFVNPSVSYWEDIGRSTGVLF